MFFVLLFIAAALVLYLLYLPYAAGLATYKIENSHKEKKEQNEEDKDEDKLQSVYVPPDEEDQRKLKVDDKKKLASKASGLRERLNVSVDDIPFKLELRHKGRTRKGADHVVDNNPNDYDYDIDELIRDEEESLANRQREEFYSQNKVEGQNEDVV